MKVPKVDISDFNYNLEDHRIATEPKSRGTSKLLVCEGSNITDSTTAHLTDFLPNEALIVRNNTMVCNARLFFKKETGAKIEVFLLEPAESIAPQDALASTTSSTWICMVGNAKKWTEGLTLVHSASNTKLTAVQKPHDGSFYKIHFEWDNDQPFARVLHTLGAIPLPPYMKRSATKADDKWYQTVFAKEMGSVAAPTASLHFDDAFFENCNSKQIQTVDLTLHVSAGTFLPVKEDDISSHEMHSEWISVSRNAIEHLLSEHKRPIIALGTTACRSLESLYYLGVYLSQNKTLSPSEPIEIEQWSGLVGEVQMAPKEALQAILEFFQKHEIEHYSFRTKILLLPGYKMKLVHGLITNFHQPKSTLLLLVAALIGDQWRNVYDYALKNKYRFLSYGDCSLLIPEKLP